MSLTRLSSTCSRAAVGEVRAVRPTELKGSFLRLVKLMRSAALELRVTVESPTSPACQGMEMDWLIYVFADFSSEPSAASMNSGSTLQTQNCHLGASYVSTLLYTIFFLCVPSMSH